MPHFVKDVEEIRARARQKLEDGAVTSTYGLEKDKSVEILNEALATEIVCVLRYMHHYFMATGVHGAAARDEFKEHADEEREHADRIAERIQQLGGKPDYNPKSLIERSVSHYVEGETLADMIREDLVAERVVIDVYREMIKYFGDKDPTTRVMIESVLEDEEEHASDLSDLLFIVNPSTGETAEQDPGTEIGANDKEEQMDRNQPQSRGRSQAQSQSQAESHNSDSSSESGDQGSSSGRGDRNQRRGSSVPELSNPTFAGADKRAKGQSNISDQPAMEPNERGGRIDRSEARPARATGQERPAAGRRDVQPAHAPGITSRVMARRGRNSVEPAEDDIAIGGQTGTNRSPKVVNKNRKNRAA